MIAYGNNIYRTLDQKFFIGDKQIGKVYKGTELIYPENKIVIDGIDIDISNYEVNGNMYDTGIQANANTRFELCIIPNGDTSKERMIFGTHHDNWSSSMYKRNSDGTCGDSTEDLTLSATNGVYPYPNKTSFHLILGKDNKKLRFRFGGNQKNSSSTSSSGGDYDLNISLSGQNVYSICLENDGRISSAFDYGKYYWEQLYNNGEITEQEKNEHINKFNRNIVGAINPNLFSGSSCHLWINGINRYLTDPNKDRTNTQNGNLEALTYYYKTSNFAFVYLIIYEYNNGTISNKFLFKQRKANNVVVFDKYDYDYINNKFNSSPILTIYPFAYCKPL